MAEMKRFTAEPQFGMIFVIKRCCVGQGDVSACTESEL